MKNRPALWIVSSAAALIAVALPLSRKLPAQDERKPQLKIETIAAKPEDVSSIEAIIKADYDCISGGVGVPRQWARDLALYDPNARTFVPSKDSKTGGLAVWTPTQTEYANASNAQFVRDGFSEREVAHKIFRFGNVATVLSSYEGTLASTGKLYGRGVNIYQVYFANNRWWISSITWDGENDINPIPPFLLQKKK